MDRLIAFADMRDHLNWRSMWAARPAGVVAAATGLGTGLAALLLYLVSIAPDITWNHNAADGGELITAAVTLGIPHPPGYPLYVLLGRLFSELPIGTVAYRFNLLSAVSMAAAAGLLAATIFHMNQGRVRPLIAAAAALLFAATPLVWGQAIVAEVYALNAALVGALLLALVLRRSATAGLLLGLAILSHSTSLLLAPLVLLVSPRRWRLAAGVLLGLSPSLVLPLLAAGDSPVVWGDPRTPADWWWLVSATLYRGNLGHWPGADHWAGLRFAFLEQLGAALVLGLWLTVAGRVKGGRAPRAGLMQVGLLLTVVLYGMFVFFYDTPDTAVLLIPALMCLALLAAAYLEPLGPMVLAAPLLLAVLSFGRVSLHDDHQVRPLAEAMFAAAPERAILLASGDQTIFAMWYFHYVEGMRPDVVPVERNLLAFDWYRERLATRYPELRGLTVDDLIAFEEQNAASRPVCAAGLTSVTTLPSATGDESLAGTTAPYLSCTE